MRQYQDSPLKQAIQSQRVVTPQGLRPASIVFDEGVIVAIEPPSQGEDFADSYILPGLVDTHVHINEPGRTDWEGFQTATRAAAAGGFTCLVDMPLNSIPATTTVAALAQKRASAEGKCMVDYAFWGGCVRGNAGELKALAAAGVRGFKCFMVPSGVDEFEMVDEADLRVAMPVIAASGLPLLVHAEFPSALLDSAGQTWTRYADYLASRPDASEYEAIRLLLQLCREYRCPIHIVHLASAEPLRLLAAARTKPSTKPRTGHSIHHLHTAEKWCIECPVPGFVTVETCPHYLCFAAETIPDGGTQYKCAPPIRSVQTQQALWDALKHGSIDLIATDHSPCPPALKQPQTGDFAKAWGGIASLSIAFSAMHTAALARGFGICDLVRWMSQKPAELAGLHMRKGALAPGFDADFVVFNPDSPFTVTPDKLHFRHAVTPYLGQRLQGCVERTFVRGECVYRHGEFMGTPAGRECRV